MRRTSPHRDHQRQPRQFDLFAPTSHAGGTKKPEWRTLPAETRQTLTRLMVRLILEHAEGDRALRQGEPRHDV